MCRAIPPAPPIPSHTHWQTQRTCLLVFFHVDYRIYRIYIVLCWKEITLRCIRSDIFGEFGTECQFVCLVMFSYVLCLCLSYIYGLYMSIDTNVCSWTCGTVLSLTCLSFCLFLIIIFSIRSRCREHVGKHCHDLA